MTRKKAPYTVGIIQMKMEEKPEHNMQKACDLLVDAAKKGVQVACLPELFRSHYFCQTEDHAKYDLAEAIPGPSTETLAKIAKDHKMVIVASLFERRTAGMYHNTAAVLDADGSMLGTYRKMHIPDDPLYYEKFYFTPGDIGFKTFDTRYGRIGVLICWDQWFPEGARLTAMQGAEVLFYPTAIGWHPAEKAQYGDTHASAWETIQRSHAIANGVYVAAANRVGHEGAKDGGLEFFGNSFICQPFGKIMAKADHSEETILTALIDPAEQEKIRQYWPFMRDRRIEHYGALTSHPSA
jgi:N-carbamoylputrescine amidase